ncbi:MAG: superoxide dismutase family protein [Cyclobacteriaceae bacterium]
MKRNDTGKLIGTRGKGIYQHLVNYLGIFFITLFLFLSACNSGSKQGDEGQSATEEDQPEEQDEAPTARATMEAASGSKVTGEANFTDQDGKVRFELSVENLSPGEHAVHLHEKGDCSAEDASSAGGHWNPTMKPHGKRGDGTSFHKGDIANMSVGNDGKGTLSLSIEGWTVGGADSTNVVGKSVIVHEKADDFTTQPSGNAGSRLSCGVIKAD